MQKLTGIKSLILSPIDFITDDCACLSGDYFYYFFLISGRKSQFKAGGDERCDENHESENRFIYCGLFISPIYH